MSWRLAAVPLLSCLTLVACGEDSNGDASSDLDRFCEISASPEPSDAFRLAYDEPSDRAAVKAFDDLLAETEDAAPSEIADEVKTYRSSARQLFAELAGRDGDLSPEGEEAQATMNEAGEAITGYVDDRCF